MPENVAEEDVMLPARTARYSPVPAAGHHHQVADIQHSHQRGPAENVGRTECEEIERRNRRAEHEANAALAVMGVGMIGSLVAGSHFSGQSWIPILSSGFEAGVVGGLADWFAVEALFRRIPIPGFQRHTDILRGKHREVATRLSAMVQNEWLTADAIDAQLASVRVSKSIESLLEDSEQVVLAVDAIRRIVRELLPSINANVLAADLAPAVRSFVGQTDIAEVLAHGVSKWLELGGDAFVWDTAAEPLAAFLESAEFRATSAAFLEDAAQRWAPMLVAQIDSPFVVDSVSNLLGEALDQRSTWAGLGILLRGVVESERWNTLTGELLEQLPTLFKGRQGEEIAEWVEAEIADYLEGRGFGTKIARFFGVINEREIAKEVVARLRSQTTSLALDASHPLRQRIKESVRGFAERLEQRDGKAIDACLEWRARNLDAQTLRDFVAAAAAAARHNLGEALRRGSGRQWTAKVPWSEISGFLGSELGRVLREASANPDHPARGLVRSVSVAISADLQSGESSSRDKVNVLFSEMLAHIDLEKIVGDLLGSGLRSLQDDLAQPDGNGASRIRSIMGGASNALRENRALATSFDNQARAFVSKLIDANRDMIGNTIRSKLLGGGSAKDADEFVQQIRKATISDLQRIRLNGALLGFLIGLLLGAVKLAF